MKCQRIYSPTPLSTLNKLTVRLQQPNGELINASPDTIDISGIFLSSYASIEHYFNHKMDLSGTVYADTPGEYIWIDCKKWFARNQVAIGDKLNVKNLTCTSPTPAIASLISYMQSAEGLTVSGIAWARTITATELVAGSLTLNQITDGNRGHLANSVLVDGSNNAGYSRFIIVRGKFMDPTTGSTAISPYGGATDNQTVSLSMLSGQTRIIPGKLINVSRQTQLIFRVITREYDSTSLIRPDNL